jgi:hypothetical protein
MRAYYYCALRLEHAKATEQGSSVRGEEGTEGDDMLLAIRLSSRGNGISQIMVECYGYIEAVRNTLLAQG